MKPLDLVSQGAELHPLLDLLSDAVVVFGSAGRLSFANAAALRLLNCEAGWRLEQLEPIIGEPALRAARDALAGRLRASALPIALPDGRRTEAAIRPIDSAHWALWLRSDAAPATPALALARPMLQPASTELLRMAWDSPFPAALEGEDFRLLDVNAAFAELSGYARGELVGTDRIDLQPEEDRAGQRAIRDKLREEFDRRDVPALLEYRLIDASGHEHWVREARRALIDDEGCTLTLLTMQDCSAEYAARERADRSVRELDDWFALSPVGMALFDDGGLLVRTNRIFDALVGPQPALLSEASAALQQLLSFDGGRPLAQLQPGGSTLERQAWLEQPGVAPRRLHAVVRCYLTPGGQRRYLVVVEERSIEEERLPAPVRGGALTDSTGVATPDIADQHRTPQRGELLLHELTTVLESTSAGIALVRANVLVRCNQRFEAMLGLAGGSAAGRDIRELFANWPAASRIAQQMAAPQADSAVVETDFLVDDGATPGLAARWYALSMRPTAQAGEAVAVLSDVTRLKAQQGEVEVLARDRELMFSLSEVGIAFVRHGRIQRVNEAFATLTGYPVDELPELPFEALFADASEYERLWAREDEHLRRRGRWSGERQLRRRDGQLLWVQVSKKLVVEGDPTGGMIASYVNVDARHRAERAVALQAERTRAILDSVLVGIVTVGARGIEWMNRSARRMFGGDLADFVNQPISTVATPEPDHPFRQTQYLDDLFEGQAETFECRVKARDGREFWIVGNVVATGRERTGRQLTYALLDIERRRQAEARSEETRASLQRLIEMAPLAIALHDARTLRVVQLNQTAAGIVGRPISELVGSTPEEMHPPETAAAMRADMQVALAAGEVTEREYTFQAPAGQRLWDARYLPLGRSGDVPDQLLLVATDVTEQRAAQEARLEAAIAQREMLVREVHHRIKNNLQGVAGLLQQIAARKPEVESVIAEVVGQVQAIAHVYGLQVGASGPLMLRSVVEAITGSLQRNFGHAIALTVEGVDAERWALPEGESIPIALTINELLTNAIKHSKSSDGAVACTLACDGEGVRIAITNSGVLGSDFTLARIPGGVSGLGLVRALLPRRSATMSLEQHGASVVATVTLAPPVVTRMPGPVAAAGCEVGSA